MKKGSQKIITSDLDLPNTTIKLYINEILCPYYRILWSKSKALFTVDKIHSYFISNGSVKIPLQEKEPSVPITHTGDFEKNFPGVDLSAPRQIRSSSLQLFHIFVFNGLIMPVSHLFLFFKFRICVLTFRYTDTSNSSCLVTLSTYYVIIAFAVIRPIIQLTHCHFLEYFPYECTFLVKAG